MRRVSKSNKKTWNNNRPSMMDLPMEIVVEILKRVPTESLGHIRCASKTLNNTVCRPSFVTMHTRHLIATNAVAQVPRPIRLVQSYGRSGQITALQSLHYDAAKRKMNASNIVATREHRAPPCNAHFVFCNLICIKHQDDERCFLVDPFRGEVLRLPAINNKLLPAAGVRVDWNGMGFDHTTNTFKIVRVSKVTSFSRSSNQDQRRLITHVLVLGASSWREIPSIPPGGRDLNWAKNVSAYGDMHWLIGGTSTGLKRKKKSDQEEETHIISFDFEKEDFYWTPHPALPKPIKLLHLITLKGSMALIDTSSSTSIEIWVMKDYNKKEWTRDYSVSVDTLDFEFWDASCCEWEHGILFVDEKCTTSFSLDLRRSVSVAKRAIICPVETGGRWESNVRFWQEPRIWKCPRILSPNGSLISLQKFRNLVEEDSPNQSSISIDSTSTCGGDKFIIEGKASWRSFFYLKR